MTEETTTKQSPPNFIILHKWAWETLPYIPGYKLMYIGLFFMVVDSINRNKWRATELPYSYIKNKCGISKETYLHARKWLIDNQILNVRTGKNGKLMAGFQLGSAVDISTTKTGSAVDIPTANNSKTDGSAVDISTHVAVDFSTHYINNKQLLINNKQVELEFEKFFCLYDKNEGKVPALREWKKLTNEEREKALVHAPKYKEYKKKIGQWRKGATNYLKDKTFNDPLTTTKNKHVYTPKDTAKRLGAPEPF